MERHLDPVIAEVDQLIEEYRDRCLWFLRLDYRPATREECLRALGYIERYGDLEGYRRAGRLKRWLLRSSSESSAG